MPPSWRTKQGAPKTGQRRAANRAVASLARQINTHARRQAAPNPGPGLMGRYESRAYRRAALETKTLDLQFTGAYADAYTADTQPRQMLNCNTGTACVQALNLCQQGTGIAQRDGNKISMKSLRLRLAMIFAKAVVQANTTNVRVLVLYDRQPNGAYPAINTILGESLQSNTIGTGTMYSNLNPNFFERFRVLMDKQITLQPFDSTAVTGTSCTGTTDPSSFKIDEFLPLKDLETLYNGTANPLTIAQITTGALYIATFGDAAAANQPWAITGTARLRFHDN